MNPGFSSRRMLVAAAVLVAAVAAGGAVGPDAAIAQQGATETVELFPVCNNVALTWPTGTAMTEVVTGISPASALQAVWRFNNAAQTFQGFSPQFPNQSDLKTVNRADPVFICMSAPGVLTRPKI